MFRKLGTVLAIGAAIGATLVGVSVATGASAAPTLTSNGSLVTYPSTEVFWSRWYSGSVTDLGQALRVDQENTPIIPFGRNVASTQAEVPVSALPSGPFIVHTRVTSLGAGGGSPTNPTKRHSVLYIGSNGLAIRTDDLTLSSANVDATTGAGDTVGTSATITPPAGTVK